MVLTSRYAVCRSSMTSKWIFNDRKNTLVVRIVQSLRICVREITINRYIIYTPLDEIKMGILPTLQRISFDLSQENQLQTETLSMLSFWFPVFYSITFVLDKAYLSRGYRRRKNKSLCLSRCWKLQHCKENLNNGGSLGKVKGSNFPTLSVNSW